MNVIITGGTGLIGRELTALLRQNGHTVTILSRNAVETSARIRNADVVGWDACTPNGWGHLVNNCQAIVNLTGESVSGAGLLPTRWSKYQKQIILQSRLQAGQAVVQAVRQAANKPAVVIQVSGVQYYGNTKDTIITEDSPPGADFMARLGVMSEDSTRQVQEMGVRHVVIRNGVNLFRSEGALPSLMLPFRLFIGGPLGSGNQYLPWIHPEDEAAAILFLIENRSAQGAFNLSAPQTVTNAQFGKILAMMLARPYWFRIPGFSMKLAFGEVADMVLTGQRVFPKRLEELRFHFKYPDLETALASVLACPIKKKPILQTGA